MDATTLTIILTVFTAISALITGLILNRFTSSWQEESTKRVELLRGEMAQAQAMSNSIMNISSSGYNISQQKRIEVIELLWKGIVMNNLFGHTTNLVYEVLLDDEIKKLYKGSIAKDNALFDFNDLNLKKFVDKTVNTEKEITLIRPFLTTKMWELYKMHGLLIGRTTLLLERGKSQDEVVLWKEDESIVSALKMVLTESEVDAVKSLKMASYSKTLRLLELRILDECNLIISGQAVTETSLKHLDRLERISQLETGMRE